MSPEASLSHNVPIGATARAVLLCTIAGYVDAIGYVTLNHVFPANMTGNTVLLAIAALQGEWPRIGSQAMTLATFFGGAVLAHMLGRAAGRPTLPFLAEAALLVIMVVAGNTATVRVSRAAYRNAPR